ncbi:MAG: hypothetical protein PHI38_06465 [Sulfurimonas sp.]|uniref:hypothetical protein n=1 Tax=Sulfurimonas sp. TaxID=2022749 RepID=UPI0026129CD9|nr:hypothetical protein [Sulfurimonas sp.]MDD3476493.1 hypothetical protein [Sulfurimonas sp.]
MFGFIKTIQQFINKLKSNKRLWFTTIFIIATFGVVLSTYLLIFTTSKTSDKVYASQTRAYELHLKSLESLIETKLHQIAIALAQNNNIIDSLLLSDKTTLEQIENEFNSEIKEEERNSLLIKIHSALNQNEILRNSLMSTIQTKNNIFGPEVIYNGIFYVFLLPVIKDERVIGIIEVRQSIYALMDSFKRLQQEQIFLLDSKMLPLLSIQNREGIYFQVGKNYLVNSKIYNTTTLGYLDNIDLHSLQQIISGEYIVTKDLYLNGVVVRDTNGVDIGLILMGQSINQDGSFVDMSKNMTNQVVMIALGLIVSLLLFLF